MNLLSGIPIPSRGKEVHTGRSSGETITLENSIISIYCMRDTGGNYYCEDTDFTATLSSDKVTFINDLSDKSLTVRYLY